MAQKYQGIFFKVGNETSWSIESSFRDALEIYYSHKFYSNDVQIWDAITGKLILK